MPEISTFSGIEDLETHLKAFQAQMLISGGLNAIKYKMLQGSFTGMALKWFSGIPNGTINSFREFSQLFGEQFVANMVKPPRMGDLFDVRQKEGEPLKKYLKRFCEISEDE